MTIGTKAQPGQFDAFDKARDDEPIFTLLGRDECAPGAITEWARLRRMKALRHFEPGSPEHVEELHQCAETVEHLRNAAYHVNESLEMLAKLGIDALAIHRANDKPGLPVFDLADALAAIREADEAVAPKRRGTQPDLDLPEPVAPSFES